jgi:hypothetical protein
MNDATKQWAISELFLAAQEGEEYFRQETLSLLRAVHCAALEEAAQVCNRIAENDKPYVNKFMYATHGYQVLKDAEKQIRALKGE